MDWMLVSPVFATGVVGLVIAFVVWGRPKAREGWAARPLYWAAVLILLVTLLAARAGVGPAQWVSLTSIERAAAVIALVAAGVVALRATKARRRAELLAATAPRALDEAVAEVRKGGGRQRGLFRGRIATDEEVTSPGGVVCAFFEAELRGWTGDGRKGRLLSHEQGASQAVWVRGERAQALVTFSLDAAFAPEQTRRCTLARRLAGHGPAFADGVVPIEAVSFEKIGRKGETCLVLGELRRGPARGSYVVGGVGGGAALMVLAEDSAPIARQLLRRAWLGFAAASALAATSAWLLS